MFIPDPNSFHHGSASKNLSILTQKTVSKLSGIWSVLFIPDPDPDFLPIPDAGVKKALDPGSATLFMQCLRAVFNWSRSRYYIMIERNSQKNYNWKFFFWSKDIVYWYVSFLRPRPIMFMLFQHEISSFFPFLEANFCLPVSWSGSGIPIQIRVQWPNWTRIQSGSDRTDTLILRAAV